MYYDTNYFLDYDADIVRNGEKENDLMGEIQDISYDAIMEYDRPPMSYV